MTAAADRIELVGDWSIAEIAGQYPPLNLHLGRLTETSPADAAPVSVDCSLAGITALDACGCQLLANFLQAVRTSGRGARVTDIPEDFTAKIHLLGFDRAFNLSAHDSGDPA